MAELFLGSMAVALSFQLGVQLAPDFDTDGQPVRLTPVGSKFCRSLCGRLLLLPGCDMGGHLPALLHCVGTHCPVPLLSFFGVG